jgi:hypothetical protein
MSFGTGTPWISQAAMTDLGRQSAGEQIHDALVVYSVTAPVNLFLHYEKGRPKAPFSDFTED